MVWDIVNAALLRTRITAGLLLLGGLLSGCVNTTVSLYEDPAYAGDGFSSFVIVSGFTNIGEREYFESAVVKALESRGLTARRGMDVVPPTRDLTPEQVNRALTECGMEAALFVQVTRVGTVESYIPPTYHTRGIANTQAGVVPFSFVTTSVPPGPYDQGWTDIGSIRATTTVTGGYEVSSPVVDYKIGVMDLANGQLALAGSARTEGRADSNSEDMLNSLIHALVEKLATDGVLVPPQ